MPQNLGEIVVQIDADFAKLSVELDKASAETEKFAKRADGSFKKFSTIVKGAGRALKAFQVALDIASELAAFVADAVNAASAIAKTADKIGLTTAALQELRFAAGQAGVDTRIFDKSIERFGRHVGEAAQGTGALKEVLDQYDIDVRNADGSTRALDSILRDLAEAAKNAGSEQESLRIAFAAFGRDGGTLANLLQRGGEGMDAMREKARSLGIVLEESLVREAESAADRIKELDAQIQANLTRFAVNFAPILVIATERLANFAEGLVRGRKEIRLFLLSLPDEISGPLLTPENDEERAVIFDRLIARSKALKAEIRALDDQIADLLDTSDGNVQRPRPGAFVALLQRERLALEVEFNKIDELIRARRKGAALALADFEFDIGTAAAAESDNPGERIGSTGPSRLDRPAAELPSFDNEGPGPRDRVGPGIILDPIDIPIRLDGIEQVRADIVDLQANTFQRFVDRAREDLRSPFDIAIEQTEKWVQIFESGVTNLTEDELEKLKLKINEELFQSLGELDEEGENAFDDIRLAAQRATADGIETLINALKDGELSFETLKEVAVAALEAIAQELIRLAAQQAALAAFGSGDGNGGANSKSSFFSLIGTALGAAFGSAPSSTGQVGSAGGAGVNQGGLGGGRILTNAQGGTIPIGRTSFVGEEGPELAIAGASGTNVIPLRPPSMPSLPVRRAGPTIQINQSFDFSRSDSNTVGQLRQESERIKRESVALMRAEVLKGGSMARDMGKR